MSSQGHQSAVSMLIATTTPRATAAGPKAANATSPLAILDPGAPFGFSVVSSMHAMLAPHPRTTGNADLCRTGRTLLSPRA